MKSNVLLAILGIVIGKQISAIAAVGVAVSVVGGMVVVWPMRVMGPVKIVMQESENEDSGVHGESASGG